jgi:hypothetical protein
MTTVEADGVTIGVEHVGDPAIPDEAVGEVARAILRLQTPER